MITVTLFLWSKNCLPHCKICLDSDTANGHLLTETLFSGPNGVSVTEDICTSAIVLFINHSELAQVVLHWHCSAVAVALALAAASVPSAVTTIPRLSVVAMAVQESGG